MGLQHEHEEYPEEYENEEGGYENQDEEGDGNGEPGRDAPRNRESIKIELDIHLDKYKATHDDDEGKSIPPVVVDSSKLWRTHVRLGGRAFKPGLTRASANSY